MKISKKTSKELNNLLHNSLKGLQEIVSDASKFTKQEFPQVAKEILVFNGYIINLSLIVLSGLGIISTYLIGKYTVSTFTPNDFGYGMGLIFAGCIGVISVPTVFSSLNDILKVKFAPRLYLIDYTKELLSKK